MSGLNDEAISVGHELIDGAEHEAKADPKDFKRVHPVGESGGSILPDSKPTAYASASASSGNAKPFGTNGSVGDSLEAKLAELREKLNIKK